MGFHSFEVKIEAEIEAKTSLGCVASFHDIVKDFEAKIEAKLVAPIDGQASMAGPDTVASLYLVVTSDIAIVILDKIFTLKLDQPSSQSLGVHRPVARNFYGGCDFLEKRNFSKKNFVFSKKKRRQKIC